MKYQLLIDDIYLKCDKQKYVLLSLPKHKRDYRNGMIQLVFNSKDEAAIAYRLLRRHKYKVYKPFIYGDGE